MKPMTLNLSQMKKIASDDDSSTFLHPSGHKMVIAHGGISALQRKQIEQIPVHKYAEGSPNGVQGVSEESPEDEKPAPIPEKKEVPKEQQHYPDDSNAGVPANTGGDEDSSTPAPAAVAPSVTAGAETANATPANAAPYSVPVSSVPASALESEEASIRGALGAEQAASKNIAGTWRDYLGQEKKITPIEDIIKKGALSDVAFQKQLMYNKINPDRYWQNASTGKHIATAIGMILGGIGSGLTGQPNMAMDNVHRAIDADIDAQKNDQSKTMNLWKMNREATHNDVQANLLTRNQLLGATEAKIKMFQAQTGGAEAQMRLAPMLLDIQRQKSENNLRIAMSEPPEKTGITNLDPSQLVPHLVKNPEQQKQVYEEIARASNMKNNSQKMLEYYDQAVKDNTVLRTGAGLLREPQSVKNLHGLMMTQFKNIDGTVRQAAKDEAFHDFTPGPGSMGHTAAEQRKGFISWMHSEMAAPVAKGNGIDLSRFRSTSVHDSQPEQIKTVNGVRYRRGPNGEAIRVD